MIPKSNFFIGLGNSSKFFKKKHLFKWQRKRGILSLEVSRFFYSTDITIFTVNNIFRLFDLGSKSLNLFNQCHFFAGGGKGLRVKTRQFLLKTVLKS